MPTEKADSVVSRSSKKRKNRKKRARQWTCYVDNLKNTIDCMYEMCRSEQSVAGCREAILHLQSASNDFKSLIETIGVEKEYANKEPEKRQSVAWEVRKSMSSPNPVNIADKPFLPISSMIAEAVRTTVDSSPQPAQTYARITAAAATVAALAVSAEQEDDGWQVVANRRRKSTSSTTVSEYDREISVEKESPEAPLNVYERLSSTTTYRRGSSSSASKVGHSDSNRLTCPRSAMDLPQTRASMAKMAYSRQLLWEKNQQMLVEKLRARQKRDKQTRTISTCSINFADPLAVRKNMEVFTQQIKEKKVLNENIKPSNESMRSLQSINEKEENLQDPSTSTAQKIQKPAASVASDDVPADPVPSSSCSQSVNSKNEKDDKGASLFGYVVDGLLENDTEWRAMTEEEESLALEENSLKLEIKQAEAISIDAELERQVEVEAEKLENAEKEKRAKRKEKKEKEEFEKMYKVFQEIQTMAWSEIMQNQPLNVHEPGTPIEKHEKMSSPSRRRCQKDDDDLGQRYEMKLRRADELREKLQEEKAAKLKELTNRVEEVRARQEALKERKRLILEERMQRAAENRDKNIMEVIRRAKDDDQRVMEVKFIATLQEDNKRYDLMMKDANLEEKQKQLAEEKARKMEEKSAKKREQEAAAVSRRHLAAEARHIRIRQLAEQKEARSGTGVVQKGKGVEKKVEAETASDAQDFLSTVLEMADESEKSGIPENSETNWPSLSRFSTSAKQCKFCGIDGICWSEFECAAHVMSEQHQEHVQKGNGTNLLEELRKNLQNFAIFKEISPPLAEETDRKIAAEKSREFLRNCQISIEEHPISPKQRTKEVKELQKALNSRNLGGEMEKMLENAINGMISAVERDPTTNFEQILNFGVDLAIFDGVLEWGRKGASLRLCIRLTHFMCILLKDARIASSMLQKPQFLQLFDQLLILVRNDPTNPQLSALFDLLNAILRNVLEKDEKKRPLKIVTEIVKYLRNSVEGEEIQRAVEANKGTGLVVRLSTFGELVGMVKGEGTQFHDEIMEILLKHAYNCAKSGTTKSEIPAMVLSSTAERMEHPNMVSFLLMVAILESELVKNVIGFDGKETRKREEKILELVGIVGRIQESYRIRSLLLPWTGATSCLDVIINNLPLKYYTLERFSAKISALISKILEKLSNLERSQVLGDVSEKFFN